MRDPELFYDGEGGVGYDGPEIEEEDIPEDEEFQEEEEKSRKTTGGCKVGIRVGTNPKISASTCAVSDSARCSHTATPTNSSWAGSSTVLSRRRRGTACG